MTNLQQNIRFNLGCGDKILPGYINVDVAPSRRGLKPDVLCDLHQLTPFDNTSADEILAVHVVVLALGSC
jgi:predicted SAM-dependent methyltransferase